MNFNNIYSIFQSLLVNELVLDQFFLFDLNPGFCVLSFVLISYSKIRQKEAKKIEESLMQDPLVDKKLAMKERLPELCRILKAYPCFLIREVTFFFSNNSYFFPLEK